MNIEQLEELVRGQPFEPFSLVMANGERLLLPHEDFIWIIPSRRVVQIALPNGASRWVNLLSGGIGKASHPCKKLAEASASDVVEPIPLGNDRQPSTQTSLNLYLQRVETNM